MSISQLAEKSERTKREERTEKLREIFKWVRNRQNVEAIRIRMNGYEQNTFLLDTVE